MGKALKLPKTECCVSKSRCDRCPIRMLKEGSLPAGYGVRKRKLVRVGTTKKVKKGELVAVMRKQKKSGKKKAA
jgi:hypothetical protein